MDVVRGRLPRRQAEPDDAAASSRAARRRPAPATSPNIITVARILLAPVFVWLLLVDGGDDGAAALGRRRAVRVAIVDRRRRRVPRARPQPRHRPRQAPRPDRRQGAHRRRARRAVDPRRAAVVGDRRHPGARGRHHRAAGFAALRDRVIPAVIAAARSRPGCRRSRSRSRSCRSRRCSATGCTWSTACSCRPPSCSPSSAASSTSGRRGAPTAPEGRRADAVSRPPRELIAELAARGLTLAVAESLTGGLLVAELVSVPGASAVVRGGVVAYATDLKHTLLGVDAALLAARRARRTRMSPGRWRTGVRRLAVDGGPPTSGSRPPASPGPTRRTASPPGTVWLGFAIGERTSTAVGARTRG